MNYTEIGEPLYNTAVKGYLDELNEHSGVLTYSGSALTNEDIIATAHAIKAIYRGISEKLNHKRYAYEFLQKCMRLTDITEAHHSRNLHYLSGIKSDFEGMIDLINGENFLDLMLSKLPKNRSVVFGQNNENVMKTILHKYELALTSLAFIEDNRLELFGGWIGFKEIDVEQDDFHFWVRDYDDSTGKISSYLLLHFDEYDMEFKGTQYRAKHFDARMSSVEIHISAFGEYKDLAKWTENKYPQYLI